MMDRLNPSDFKGSRVYFTNFDPRIVSRHKDHKILKINIERKLKTLLLTKNIITCAASHLISKFTYQLFRDNPILLNKSLIIPAFRIDKNEISELFENKSIPKYLKSEMLSFYNSNINKTVDWKYEDNSKWFRDRFIFELKDEYSVLRKNLISTDINQINYLIFEIEKESFLSRDKIDKLSRCLKPNERKALLIFRELIYHISGARVVNCQSALPQENYIDYSLTDMNNHKIILSEIQIFWKLFLELVIESLEIKSMPIELIDKLSFEDIINIRNVIENSTFKDTYNKLINKSIECVNDSNSDNVFYHTQDLINIRNNLFNEFSRVMNKEMQIFINRKRVSTICNLGLNSIALSLGVASFIPLTNIISTIANSGSLLIDSPAVFMNLNQIIKDSKSINNYNYYIKTKEKMILKTIKKSKIKEETDLIDVINLLTKVVTQRIAI